jgi:hypothetical protein
MYAPELRPGSQRAPGWWRVRGALGPVAAAVSLFGCTGLAPSQQVVRCSAEGCPGDAGALRGSDARAVDVAPASTPPSAPTEPDAGAGAPGVPLPADAAPPPDVALPVDRPPSPDARPPDVAVLPQDTAPPPASPPPPDAAPPPPDLAPDLPPDLPPPPPADPRCRPASAPGAGVELLDDFEDRDLTLLARGGRNGEWRTGTDGTSGGSHLPSPFAITTIAACTQNRGYLAIRGSGFTEWGSELAVDFFSPARSYDLGDYGGVQFWARMASGDGPVRFQIANRDTDPLGNTCGSGCYNHFGKDLSGLGSTWQLFTIRFAEMRQEQGWGKQIAGGFDAAAAYSIYFLFPDGSTYDLWIDDLALVQ